MSQLELTKGVSVQSSVGSAAALLSATSLARSAHRSARRLCCEVEKKAVRRMVVAGFPAVVDGPLPVGDVVALALEAGCLAWSFHEVYEAQGTVKLALHRELSVVMKQNSTQIRAWAMTVGNELMEIAALSTPAPRVRVAARLIAP